MADKVELNELRTWHESIMATAKGKYATDGWDIFVECVGVKDFVEDYNNNYFVDFIGAVDYYTDVCRLHNERRQDIMAEAF